MISNFDTVTSRIGWIIAGPLLRIARPSWRSRANAMADQRPKPPAVSKEEILRLFNSDLNRSFLHKS